MKFDAQADVEWPNYSSDVLKIDFENSFQLDATDNFTSSVKEISDLDLTGSVNENCVVQGKLSLHKSNRSFPNSRLLDERRRLFHIVWPKLSFGRLKPRIENHD